MEGPDPSRRSLLRMAVQLPLGATLFALSVRARGADSACVDPDELSSGESSLRSSLHYVEKSADAQKTCQVCAYFHADKPPCGQCAIFNGAANASGHCDSWSAKAA